MLQLQYKKFSSNVAPIPQLASPQTFSCCTFEMSERQFFILEKIKHSIGFFIAPFNFLRLFHVIQFTHEKSCLEKCLTHYDRKYFTGVSAPSAANNFSSLSQLKKPLKKSQTSPPSPHLCLGLPLCPCQEFKYPGDTSHHSAYTLSLTQDFEQLQCNHILCLCMVFHNRVILFDPN